MSSGVENLPRGMVDRNLDRIIVVSSPMKVANSGVSPATGLIALTLIPWRASSIAIVFVAVFIHPLDALYQFKFGRGEIPAVEAIFNITPDLFNFICGTKFLADK